MIKFKQFFLLNEGGLGGHMDHLYDHWDLTFGVLKDLFTKASVGEIEGTEKTDGQNIFITYNIEKREARAVRNKGTAKSGGMDAKQLAAKFGDAGKESVQAVFLHAFNMFQKGIEALSDDEIIDLFGRDGNIFYNAEIIDSRTSNVINYDVNTLLVHRDAEYVAVNFRTGELKGGYDRSRSNRLMDALEKMNEVIEGGNYQILGDAMRKLNALENDTALRDAILKINKLGVKDSDRIKDYIIRNVKRQLQTAVPHLKPAFITTMIVKIVGSDDEDAKQPNITSIISDLDAETKVSVKGFYDNRLKMIKDIVAPIESIVHDFSVEMLKAFNSTLIIDNKKEIQRLRQEVEGAIKSIEGSGHEGAIEILKQQLAKLQSAENVSSAAEGFVFRFDGHTYKFTGNFAPVNQILGMFKYGRGKIKPEDLRAR